MSDNLRFLSALAALTACFLVAACGSTSMSSSSTATKPTTRAAATHGAPPLPAPNPKPKPRPKPKPKPPAPGSLPQTDRLPSADTPAFHSKMGALWQGILKNSVQTAMPAFFPERAYVRLKAVGDAAGDFENRLVGGYRLDIGAAHALVSAGDRLVAVHVPASYVHWVDPQVCYNTVGYYEVPNSRVVYNDRGATKSFGIASMISWRGVWYVVHLGSVLSPGSVDDPSVGAGVSAPSSTC